MITLDKQKRGAMAKSRECSKNQKQEKRKTTSQTPLSHITYYDHVLFKNCDPNQIKPAIRQTIGWITFENQQAIIVSSDISAKLLKHEKIKDSGMLILKNLIIKRTSLEFNKAFKHTHIAYCRIKNPYKTEK